MPTRIVSHRSLAGAFADQGGRAFARPVGGLEASGPEAEDQAFMTAYLGDALRAIEDAETLPGVMVAPGHQLASLIQSYLAENPDGNLQTSEQPLPGGGIEVKYDSGDVLGWARSVFSWWRRIRKQPWRAPSPAPEPLGTNGRARIALLADWGTGLYGAVQSAQAIEADGRFDLLMHLGDVYYSGTRKEVRENFLAKWPKVPGAISRALNSNHEMYCGGDGLFNETLPAFGQAGTTCALQTDDWLLVGLDSGYDDHDLHGEQAAWLEGLIDGAGDRRVILFSHHQPYSLLDSQGPKLAAKLAKVLAARQIFAWYLGPRAPLRALRSASGVGPARPLHRARRLPRVPRSGHRVSGRGRRRPLAPPGTAQPGPRRHPARRREPVRRGPPGRLLAARLCHAGPRRPAVPRSDPRAGRNRCPRARARLAAMALFDQPELDYVRSRLAQKLVTGNMGVWFVTWTTPAFFGSVPQVPVPSDMAERALAMAQELSAPATFRYPGALEGILNGLDPVIDVKIQALRARVMALAAAHAVPAVPGADPLDDPILQSGLIFWNRKALHDAAKPMLKQGGRPILLVNGVSGSGKSYTAEWLQHAKWLRADFVLGTPVMSEDTSGVAADALGDAAIEADLKEMARQIVKALNLEPTLTQLPVLQGKSLNQYVDRLSDWILGHLPSNGGVAQYRIVLDGYGKAGTSPACRTLVPALAKRAVRPGPNRDRVRLVLLDFPAKELAAVKVDSYITEETIPAVCVDHVRLAIRAGLQRANLEFTDDDVDGVLEAAREQVADRDIADTDPLYAYALNCALRQLLAL